VERPREGFRLERPPREGLRLERPREDFRLERPREDFRVHLRDFERLRLIYFYSMF